MINQFIMDSDQYSIIGYNNNKFDNIFLFNEITKKELVKTNTIITPQFVNNQIRNIQVGTLNNRVRCCTFDLNAYIAGSLAYNCEQFKIPQ